MEDLAPVSEQFLKINKLSKQLHKLHLKEREFSVDLADILYKSSEDSPKAEAAQKKVDEIQAQIAEVEKEIAAEHEVLDKMREPYKDDERFQKYEGYRDDGIDLARLKYEEMRQLRSDLQLIFQDPYSSLNPRMSVGQIIGESLVSHGFYTKTAPDCKTRSWGSWKNAVWLPTSSTAILTNFPAVSARESALHAVWLLIPSLSFAMRQFPHWMYPFSHRLSTC